MSKDDKTTFCLSLLGMLVVIALPTCDIAIKVKQLRDGADQISKSVDDLVIAAKQLNEAAQRLSTPQPSPRKSNGPQTGHTGQHRSKHENLHHQAAGVGEGAVVCR